MQQKQWQKELPPGVGGGATADQVNSNLIYQMAWHV